MAKEGGFFSGSERRDNRIAGGFSGYSTEDKKNVINYQKKKAADPSYQPKSYELESLKRQTMPGGGLVDNKYFSPKGQEVGQIASATTDLSGLIASGDKFDKDGYNQYLKKFYGMESEDRIYKNYPNYFKRDLRDSFKDDVDSGYFTPKSKEGAFAPQTTDTKVAMGGDNLGSFGAIGGVLGLAGLGIKGIQSAIEGGKNLKENIERRLNPESMQDKVGGFFNRLTGISPVAAGTLDANQQVSQVSERPKLNYVNPDAKTMSGSEIREAFKPKNLFGYQDKFGRFDDPGSPLARDRAETMQRVAQNFTSPIVGDARTIGQIRADQQERMRENARLRNESFQRGERVQQKSADVTYGTNMLSNPAFGFRDKMTDAAKAQYDRSAKDATEMARTDPSLGNVIAQTVNRVTGLVGGPQMSLESIGERQLRLADKEINRPTYQKEAYARKMLGITNDQLKARNLQQIRANAAARNQAFQADRRAKAVERAARRYGQNTGSGRTGGFGSGTVGQGMSSNPAGMRQQGVGVSANNLSRHKAGPSASTSTSTGTSSSRSRGGISRSTSRGQGGGPSSRSRGGVSRGGSKAKSSGSRGQGGGKASRSKGGSFGGSRRSTNRSKSRRRCDIRTKIDITSLTNQNLIKDDLAIVAYFVQELRDN